jgi:hypothetical protein
MLLSLLSLLSLLPLHDACRKVQRWPVLCWTCWRVRRVSHLPPHTMRSSRQQQMRMPGEAVMERSKSTTRSSIFLMNDMAGCQHGRLCYSAAFITWIIEV